MKKSEKTSPLQAITLTRNISIYLVLAGWSSVTHGQTIYYVASSGNDANTGQTIDSPFQSIVKINTLSLQPGDQVLFKRNDTFRGALQIRQSGLPDKPILISAYGDGSKPILAGSVQISNWSSLGNNIWQANCPGCGDRVTGLYRNNVALPLGRYPNLDTPNKGYLTVLAHSGKPSLRVSNPCRPTG